MVYTIDFIKELYETYAEDLIKVINRHNTLRYEINKGSDNVECEISYLLFRHFKPKTVFERAPNEGWSTCWILSALRDNGFGKLYSYDIVDLASKKVPKDLSEGRWAFVQGDAVKLLDEHDYTIDYLYIDADHYCEFTNWYLTKLIPNLKTGTPISIHDIYHDSHPETYIYEERGSVMKWLSDNSIPYFSPSKFKDQKVFEYLCSIRSNLGIPEIVDGGTVNPMIYLIKQ